MDFMVPLADGSVRLPDEVGTPLNCRKRLGEISDSRTISTNPGWPVGRNSGEDKIVFHGETVGDQRKRWVPTVTEGPGRIRYLVISNIGDRILRLDHRLDVGMILNQDKVSRSLGFVSVGSRRCREWQKLALESTVDTRSGPPELMESPVEPTVQRPSYPTPRSILRRAGSAAIDRDRTARIADANQIEAEFLDPEKGSPSTPTTSPDADRYLSGDADGAGIKAFDVKSRIHPTEGVEPRDPSAEGAAATTPQDADDDDEIYCHESGDLSTEDLEGNLAVLPEIPISTTPKVSIEDLQVGDAGSATPEEIEKLRQIIWKKQHLLIGKGNALPPVAKGIVCDIDVGNAKPIAL
ncbi:hypothetical protein PHMEG_0006660 [Phytophthora megakarya]|uniref:Eukaryotic/viral aspartic protease n=1 Tax=Phytophthora megakarya TaxID=4795 RepID=A0A225WPU2_9STRA|nr:hypothetical protein PHMEG_0006660 [Phytophthora megakarya]